MKCSLLGKDAPADRLARVADFLVSCGDSKDPGRRDRILKVVKEAASASGAGRILVLADDKGRVDGACLFNVCLGLGGPYLFISELEMGSMENASALAKQLVRWAREQGYAYIASAVDPSDAAVRKAAKAHGMEERPAFWLEMHVQDAEE